MQVILCSCFNNCASLWGCVRAVLKDNSSYANYSLGVGLTGLIICWLADSAVWQGHRAWIAFLLHSIVVIHLLVGSILKVDVFPAAPMLVFLALIPIFLSKCRKIIFPNLEATQTLHELHIPVLIVAISIILAWCVWVFQIHRSGDYQAYNPNKFTREYHWCATNGTLGFGNKGLKAVNGTSSPKFASIISTCDTPFLIWISPIICGVYLILYGKLCQMLASELKSSDTNASQSKGPGKEDSRPQKKTQKLTRIASLLLGVGLATVYVSASVSGMNMGIADILTTLALLLVITVLSPSHPLTPSLPRSLALSLFLLLSLSPSLSLSLSLFLSSSLSFSLSLYLSLFLSLPLLTPCYPMMRFLVLTHYWFGVFFV